MSTMSRTLTAGGSISRRAGVIPWPAWLVLFILAVWGATYLPLSSVYPESIGGIDLTIPLADWVNRFVFWTLRTFNVFFDRITEVILWILVRFENFLTGLPWVVVLAVIGLGGWISTRSYVTTTVLVLLMLMVGSFGLWELAMITLALIFASVLLSLLIGLPIGILAAQSDKFDTAIKPLLDGMQTMPAFVYLIPVMMFFGLGKVPAVIATIVYAVPPLIRLTNLGIRGVSPSAIEAAQAYGATHWQILKDVEVPLALPAIMAGVNQTTMMALAMVVIASLVGATGLGQEVLLAINRIDAGRGAEAGLSIVALAIVIDRITQGFARRYEESIS